MSKFLLNTDHPIDKIAWVWEEELKLNYNSDQQIYECSVEFEHGVGAQIFAKGIWTIDDWQTTWIFGSQRRETINGVETLTIDSGCQTDETYVKYYIKIKSDSQPTAKVRLWGVVNENATKGLDLNPTIGFMRNRFGLNTDFNYPSLRCEGTAHSGDSITPFLFDTIPYVDVWAKNPNLNNRYSYVTENDYFAPSGDTHARTPSIKIWKDRIEFRSNTPQIDYYFRVYEP